MRKLTRFLFSLKGNGTKLAASCENYSIYIWEYPGGHTLTKGKYKAKESGIYAMIVWNPFNPDVLASFVPRVGYYY